MHERIKRGIIEKLCECGCLQLLKVVETLHETITACKKEFWEDWERMHPVCIRHTDYPVECSSSCCDISFDCSYCESKPDQVPLNVYASHLQYYYEFMQHATLAKLTDHLIAQYDHNEKVRKVKERNDPLDDIQPSEPESFDNIDLDAVNT